MDSRWRSVLAVVVAVGLVACADSTDAEEACNAVEQLQVSIDELRDFDYDESNRAGLRGLLLSVKDALGEVEDAVSRADADRLEEIEEDAEALAASLGGGDEGASIVNPTAVKVAIDAHIAEIEPILASVSGC
ncbi:MAG: hypothetical protein ACRD0A_12525 [Acidimicrobiales bacterium]